MFVGEANGDITGVRVAVPSDGELVSERLWECDRVRSMRYTCRGCVFITTTFGSGREEC